MNTKSTYLTGTGRQAGPIRRDCPPLTPDDILVLRGQPVTKRIEPSRNTPVPMLEEWIYYQKYTNTKEYYVFKNGRLIGWEQKTSDNLMM